MEKECLHCETKFTPKNPKGKFCSDRCKVAYSRKNKGQNVAQKEPAVSIPASIKKEKIVQPTPPKIVVQDLTKETGKIIPVTSPKPTTNVVIKTTLKDMLKKEGYDVATSKKPYKAYK